MSNAPVKQFELVSFDNQLELSWSLEPGGAFNDGLFTVLHTAPKRWVLIDPDAATIERLATQVAAGRGVLTDISGKWVAIQLTESQLRVTLSAGAAVEVLIHDCDCAALYVFDCPALVAKDRSSFRIWVQSSFVESFFSVVARCDVGLET